MLLIGLVGCQSLPTSSEWIARGDGYFKDGKIVQAVQAYNRAEKLNPQQAEVYASRGTAYFFNGDYALAQQDFAKVVEMNPYRADAYTALASALAAQGDYNHALRVINRSVGLDPNKAETFFTRGGINFMLGKYDQAVYDYSTVLALRPAADVYNARAAAYLKLGKTKEAEADFEMAKSGQVPQKLNDYTMID